MEIIRSFLGRYPDGFSAYMALERALMRHYVARGGTELEFCERLAAAFHRRYAPVLLGDLAQAAFASGDVRKRGRWRPRAA